MRQYVDWRPLRHLDVRDTAAREAIERICDKIVEALRKPWVSPEEHRKQQEIEARQRADAVRWAEEERRQAEAARLAEEEQRRAVRQAEEKQRRAAAAQRAAEENRPAKVAERGKILSSYGSIRALGSPKRSAARRALAGAMGGFGAAVALAIILTIFGVLNFGSADRQTGGPGVQPPTPSGISAGKAEPADTNGSEAAPVEGKSSTPSSGGGPAPKLVQPARKPGDR
jgi:hypothetical protein